MTSPSTYQGIFDRDKITPYDHDPGASTAVLCSPDGGTTVRSADLQNFQDFAIVAKNSVLVGAGITRVEIIAADDASLATHITVIKDSGVVVTNDMDKFVALTTCASDVRGESATARYVGARITMANAGDEAVVTYIQSHPRYNSGALTASTT